MSPGCMDAQCGTRSQAQTRIPAGRFAYGKSYLTRPGNSQRPLTSASHAGSNACGAMRLEVPWHAGTSGRFTADTGNGRN